MRVLITGITGMAGSHLAEYLLANHPDVAVYGTFTYEIPPHLADEMAAGIKGARLVKVADCGHISTLEQPEAVTRELIDWMRT